MSKPRKTVKLALLSSDDSMRAAHDLKPLKKRSGKIIVGPNAAKASEVAPMYYDFEITLVGTQPRVWRRCLLKEQASFDDLHDAIQTACGWQNSHLYSFFAIPSRTEIATSPVAREDIEGSIEKAPPDARRVKLSSYFSGKTSPTECKYVYDFGDNWEHRVVMLGLVERAATFNRQLLDGARAFPPEDCGGMPGYEDCVSFKTGASKGDGADDLGEWLGNWDPESFELPRISKKFTR